MLLCNRLLVKETTFVELNKIFAAFHGILGIQCHLDTSLLLVPILGQISSVHILNPYEFNIQINIYRNLPLDIPTVLISSCFQIIYLYSSRAMHVVL
jgi:hypothetical protein